MKTSVTTVTHSYDKKTIERFWSKVDRHGPNGCWQWTDYLSPYGVFRVNGKARGAHRFAWELANGHIPDGVFVLHKCDNPGCVNPAHMFLGTHSDNMADKVKKGRQSHHATWGSKHGLSVLKDDDIQKIHSLASTTSNTEIARRFGVSRMQVWRILTGKQWRRAKP